MYKTLLGFAGGGQGQARGAARRASPRHAKAAPRKEMDLTELLENPTGLRRDTTDNSLNPHQHLEKEQRE